ncbi:NAD(P)H-binding protein [Candidatus Saccharibacteria bacterium]|nr:NAD(P)H-binding protein [Candidatus Saccharibacteria bacterium]
MRIAVIAANGRLGSIFVEEALAAGHSVRAGVRGESRLSPHSNLEVVQCDATRPEELRKLLKDQQVVVSALGHVKGSSGDVQTIATRKILEVMQEQGIKRFVDVTGTGVRFPGDKIGLVDVLLNLAVKIIDPPRVKDGIDHERLLRTSNIDWTTIRILKLQDVTIQPFELLLHGPTKWYVGRQEVARAMLEVIEKSSFIKQAPIIGKPTKEKK